MTTSGITNINAKLIHQHPDNPRKDLGDLSELSESIKKKGIMQNLTVIPGYWDENRAHHDEGYTLIIGHRRFAAGKMAGVTMYPCRIVQDMSYKDQVGTMLEENMQRIDLTVLEQAEGFQMIPETVRQSITPGEADRGRVGTLKAGSDASGSTGSRWDAKKQQPFRSVGLYGRSRRTGTETGGTEEEKSQDPD